MEKKRRRLNRDIPSEAESQLSLIKKQTILYHTLQAMATMSHRNHGPWGCQRMTAISPRSILKS